MTVAGLTLLGLVTLQWILVKVRSLAVSGLGSGDFPKRPFVRYPSYLAILLIVLGIGQALSNAREEAIAKERVASVTASLNEPLRRRLAISDPGNLAYQEQLRYEPGMASHYTNLG